jgi:cysteine synthase A
LNGNGNGHASFDEEKLISHPRGFFADQFEVSPNHWTYVNVDRNSFHRTAATSMRISPARVLKYGARRMVKSSVSSLVLVSLLLSPLRSLSDAELSEGTGGTIAGCGQFLKSMADHILVALADPEGSGLYNKVN